MITINNKEYRNIVEQVQKNKEDIARHYEIDRVIAEVGIKVMGQLETAPNDDLIPPGGEEAFGEAYLVGAAEPYDIYVWTRPGEWFNIGALNMIGDQGPAGDSITKAEITDDNKLKLTMSDGRVIVTKTALATVQGDKGDIGPINAIVSLTIDPQSYKPTLTFSDGSTAKGNISIRGEKGDQGEQGLQGPQGVPGMFYYIRGIVDSIDDLKNVPITDMRTAYLVGTTTPYFMYVPVGEGTGMAQWVYMGAFNTGSIITVDGIAQTQYEMNNKLTIAEPKTGYQAYIQAPNTKRVDTQLLRPTINTADKYQFVIRDVIANANSGQIQVPETPLYSYHAASKAYVDKFAAQIGVKFYQHHLTIGIDGNSYIYLNNVNASKERITTTQPLPYDITMSCSGYDSDGKAIIAFTNYGSEGFNYTKVNGDVITIDLLEGDHEITVNDEIIQIS